MGIIRLDIQSKMPQSKPQQLLLKRISFILMIIHLFMTMLVYGSCMLISYLVFFITLGKCRALLPICEHLRFRAHICMIFFFYSFLGVAKPYSAAEKIVDYISDKEKHNPYNVSPSVSDLYKILKLWKV